MKVKFVPIDKELEIQPGQSVMDLAHQNDIEIKSVCNGMPSCAECRVRVVDGDWNILAPSSKEIGLIGTGYFIDQRRLSCQLKCFGDITVDVTEQVERSKEDNLTKKFLERAQKSSAEESHSVGGILVEQENSAVEGLAQGDDRDGSDAPQGSSGILDQVSSKSGKSGAQRKKKSRNQRNAKGAAGQGRNANRQKKSKGPQPSSGKKSGSDGGSANRRRQKPKPRPKQ